MNAGTYLRLRREAAGLSIDDVATLMADQPCWRQFNTDAIGEIEAGRWIAPPSFMDRMRGAFAFDRFIVRQLICRLDPAPEICRACGCSALDACDDEITGPCAWASPAHDLCTSCATRDGSTAVHHQEKHHA